MVHKEEAAIKFDSVTKSLQVLDQTRLPNDVIHVQVSSCEDGFNIIKNMVVRGAPGIAAVGCLSIICELHQLGHGFNTYDELNMWIKLKAEYMLSSRPSALNLRKALEKLKNFNLELQQCQPALTIAKNIEDLTEYCLKAIHAGELSNRDLGVFGALALEAQCKDVEKLSILTHCNTGSLATVGYGTALGIVRSLHERGKLERAYCTETRPFNHGSRLTAWELVREQIPASLIADNMVAYLFATKKIDAVVVGADCVAINGDTSNKIGSLQIAVIAKHYGIPFYVAAPTQSICASTKDMSKVDVELRPADELRKVGGILLAPEEIDVWNPCSDVTPASLITGIITEFGACKPSELECLLNNLEPKSGKGPLY